MRQILVTGGTGLIGTELVHRLLQQEDARIWIISRHPANYETRFPPHVNLVGDIDLAPPFDELNVLINLSGAPIADRRWSLPIKREIRQSRWQPTQELVNSLKGCQRCPEVFISGSAVGYYGDQGEQVLDESCLPRVGNFAHEVCDRWEAIALAAQPLTRVCILRTGIVLTKAGGLLKKLLPIYQAGLGGSLGNGRQYLPWIHIDDMINAILFLLNNSEASGVFNMTAPQPVSYREFSQTLARQLHKPHWLHLPAPLLQVIFGEMSQMLLQGQRAIPAHLQQLGFQFSYPELVTALAELLPAKE